MTTAVPDRMPPGGAVPGDMLRSFAERAMAQGRGAKETRWLGPTTAAMSRLPWFEENLPDGRTPPQPAAAAGLLWLLVRALDDDTIPPTGIIPTWRGGVSAEWHVNGFDLEVTCEPDGALEYNFAGPGIEEYEGPVDETLAQLRQHVRMLPQHREQAPP